MPFLCGATSHAARNQSLSGRWLRCSTVPAVTEVCRWHRAHSTSSVPRPSSQALSCPQPGQRNPSGQRFPNSQRAQAASSGNCASNSGNEPGRSTIATSRLDRPDHNLCPSLCQRDKRSHEIGKLEIAINDLRALGIEYWALLPDDPNITRYERKIKSVVVRIGSLINSIGDITGDNMAHLIRSHRHLNRAITTGQFEVRDRQPEPSRQPDIDAAANELIEMAKAL